MKQKRKLVRHFYVDNVKIIMMVMIINNVYICSIRHDEMIDIIFIYSLTPFNN